MVILGIFYIYNLFCLIVLISEDKSILVRRVFFLPGTSLSLCVIKIYIESVRYSVRLCIILLQII